MESPPRAHYPHTHRILKKANKEALSPVLRDETKIETQNLPSVSNLSPQSISNENFKFLYFSEQSMLAKDSYLKQQSQTISLKEVKEKARNYANLCQEIKQKYQKQLKFKTEELIKYQQNNTQIEMGFYHSNENRSADYIKFCLQLAELSKAHSQVNAVLLELQSQENEIGDEIEQRYKNYLEQQKQFEQRQKNKKNRNFLND